MAGSCMRAGGERRPVLGLRGGSGNFGVVASFEYRVRPVGPTVFGGLVAHPYSTAAEVLRFYRELTSSASDDLPAYAALIHAPDGMSQSSPRSRSAMSALAGRRARARPAPGVRIAGPLPSRPDAVHGDQFDARRGISIRLAQLLEVELHGRIDGRSDRGIHRPLRPDEKGPMTAFLLEHVHGAATRVPDSATAFEHRTIGFNVLIPSSLARCGRHGREHPLDTGELHALQPHLRRGRYVNYMAEDMPAKRRRGRPTAATSTDWWTSRPSTTRRTCST